MAVVLVKAGGERVFVNVVSSDGRQRLYRVDASDRKCSAQLTKASDEEVKSVRQQVPQK